MSKVITDGKKRRIYKKTGGKCYYCGKALYIERDIFWCNPFAEKMTIDHLIPQASGGTDNIKNLLPSCGRCNCIKGCLNPIEHQYLLSKLLEGVA